LKTTKQ